MFGPNLSGSPDEVDWESLAALLKVPYPLFEKTLFLQGYEFSSNIYVITGDYLAIIDPGNDYTAFMELFSLGFKPTDIKKIVLTHGHVDHVGGTISSSEVIGVTRTWTWRSFSMKPVRCSSRRWPKGWGAA